MKNELLKKFEEHLRALQLSDDELDLWTNCYQNTWNETQDEMMSKLAADGAVQRSRTMVSVKSAPDGTTTVAGWGMLFTDSDELDLQDTYFDNMTKTLAEYYPHAPFWMEHGFEEEYGWTPIGYRTHLKVYRRGIWVEHALHADHPLYEESKRRAASGEYSLSSDSVGHYVEQGFNPEDGYLGVWPLVGWSMVKNPAEPGLGPVAIKSLERMINNLSERAGAPDPEPDGQLTLITISDIEIKDGNSMDPMLEALAQFLGVEATPEAVGPALDQYIQSLQESGQFPPELAAALGLDASATLDDVIARLQELGDTLKGDPVPEEEAAPAPAMSNDFSALSRAVEHVTKSKRENKMPVHTRGGAKGSRQYGSVNVNRGAKKANLGDAVMALASKQPHRAKGAFKASPSYTDNIGGGYTLNRELSAEILEPLYSTELVMALGADVEKMDGIESLTVRKMLSGSDAYWAGQGQSVNDSEVKFGVVTLNLHELVARIRIPNRLLRNTANLESRVKDDLIKKLRLRMDKSFLFGTGSKPSETGHSGAEPLGLVNTPNVNTTELGSGNGAVPTLDDLADAVGEIEDRNVENAESWGWAFAPRTKRVLTKMKDADGLPIFRDTWSDAERAGLLGYDWLTSTQIPKNLTVGTSTDCTDIFLGDWQYSVVGMGMDVELAVDTSRYINERETLIQAVIMVDFAVYYPEAFQIITGVRS